MVARGNIAYLGNQGNMTVFECADQLIRFRAPDILRRYTRINLWDKGYIEVTAEYEGVGVVEEYIDIVPVLENLMIDANEFLAGIDELKLKDYDETEIG